MKKLLFHLIYLLCFGANSLSAQITDLSFHYFGSEETRINSRLTTIGEGEDGVIWLGSEADGVALYNGYEFNYIQSNPSDTSSLPNNRILGVLKLRNGNFLVGTIKGASIYSKNGLFIKNLNIEGPDINLKNLFCEALGEDPDGILWIGTQNGLMKYNVLNDQFEVFSSDVFEDPGPNQNENFFIRLKIDPNNPQMIWCGSQYGLRSFNKQTEQFTEHPHPPKWHGIYPKFANYSIFDLEFSSPDLLWITAWQSGGILSYNTLTGEWQQYLFEGGNKTNPYLKNDVFCLEPINDSVVIFGARHGLGMVDMQKMELIYHSNVDISTMGYIRESLVDQNGILWLVGEKGFVRSKLPILDKVPVSRSPKITGIQTNRGEIKGMDQKEFKFPTEVNELSIISTLINPVDPELVEYRWKLNGYDKDWRFNGNERQARYTNLSGGHYSFQFESKKPDSDWQAGETISIQIEKPFYLKNYFLLLMAALIGLGLFGIIRLTAHITRREATIKSGYERKLIDAELTALRSQMNPHFIFNSLNSIYNFILNNDTENAAEYLVKFSKLMRMVLAHSKQTVIKLSEELDVIGLYLELERIRFNEKFSFSIQVDDTLDRESILLPPMLIQPFLENAIWHGLMHKSEKGRLDISLFKTGEQLLVTITDDGIGREKSREINKSKTKKSFGIDITQKRMDSFEILYQKKAKLSVIDLVDSDGLAAGTEVHLEIPFIKQ